MESSGRESSITPSENRQLRNRSSYDSGVSVLPCLSDSSTDVHENHSADPDMEVPSSCFAVPEDPLIDFHKNRERRRQQEIREMKKTSQSCQLTIENHREASPVVQKVPDDLACNSSGSTLNDLAQNVHGLQVNDLAQNRNGSKQAYLAQNIYGTEVNNMAQSRSCPQLKFSGNKNGSGLNHLAQNNNGPKINDSAPSRNGPLFKYAGETTMSNQLLKIWSNPEKLPSNSSANRIKFLFGSNTRKNILAAAQGKRQLHNGGNVNGDNNGDSNVSQKEAMIENKAIGHSPRGGIPPSMVQKKIYGDSQSTLTHEAADGDSPSHVTQKDSPGECPAAKERKKGDSQSPRYPPIGTSTYTNQPHKQQAKYNVGPTLVVKATKFLLNGEVCYLVPAKVLGNRENIFKHAASTKRNSGMSPKITVTAQKVKVPKTNDESQTTQPQTSNAKKNGKRQNGPETPVTKTPSPIQNKQPHPFFKANRAPFEDITNLSRFSPDVFFKSLSRKKRNTDHLYPSIRNFKSNKMGTPRIRISRLQKSTPENDAIGEGSKDKNDESNSNKGSSPCTGPHDAKDHPPVNAAKEQKQKNVLKFVIQSPLSGTRFFINDQKYQDYVDAATPEQLVPNAFNGSVNGSTAFKTPSPRTDKKTPKERKVTKYQEMKQGLMELKRLVPHQRTMTELELIQTTEFLIKNLESQVKDLLHQLGIQITDQSLNKIFPMSFMTSLRASDCMNSRLLAIDPNSITIPETAYTSFSRIGNEAEYNVPDIEENKISPYENSLYLPNSPTTSSPQLSIGGHDFWAPGSSQAPNELVLSQESTQSVFHNRASQVSFSDSLTDDSEAVHEFDLQFEGEVTERNAGKIFQKFVDRLLDDCDEFDDEHDKNEESTVDRQNDEIVSTSRLTPVNTQESIEGQEIFTSPRVPTIIPDSALLVTPPQFSVNNLDFDPKHLNETSLLMREKTPELNINNTLADEDLLQIMSLKVIGRGTNHVVTRDLCQNAAPGRPVSSAVGLANDSAEQHVTGNFTMQAPLFTGMTPKIVMAKDLLKSGMLTSFLNPSPITIPEDPFGIGAETSVGCDEAPNSWNDRELTPPMTKRGIAGLGVPPVINKKSRGTKRKSLGASKDAAKKFSKKFCVPTFSRNEEQKENYSGSSPEISPRQANSENLSSKSILGRRKALEPIDEDL